MLHTSDAQEQSEALLRRASAWPKPMFQKGFSTCVQKGFSTKRRWALRSSAPSVRPRSLTDGVWRVLACSQAVDIRFIYLDSSPPKLADSESSAITLCGARAPPRVPRCSQLQRCSSYLSHGHLRVCSRLMIPGLARPRVSRSCLCQRSGRSPICP